MCVPFRTDRKGHAIKVRGFRKAWYSGCIRAWLGNMEPKIDRVAGEQVHAAPRGPRSKAKMVYGGASFHDLRRGAAGALLHAGMPEKVIAPKFRMPVS
jgi:hypothetical protein